MGFEEEKTTKNVVFRQSGGGTTPSIIQSNISCFGNGFFQDSVNHSIKNFIFTHNSLHLNRKRACPVCRRFEMRVRFYIFQFSSLRLGTFLKCFVLFVTKVKSL